MTIKGEKAKTKKVTGRKYSKKLPKHLFSFLHTQNVRLTKRIKEKRVDHTRKLSRLSEIEFTYHQ